MLEVRKNTFARSYENTFFREFARALSKRFEQKGFHGLLLGSPYCEVEERLQIDALLITSNAICIIDFKNYSGNVHLPDYENFKEGLWLDDDGIRIKGGSYINPFVQVTKQKTRFEQIFKRYIAQDIISSDRVNIYHTEKIVCFQNPVQIHGDVPPAFTNFHVTDKVHFTEKILDVIDIKNQTSLSVESFDAFKEVFLAAQYEFDDPTEPDITYGLEEHVHMLDMAILHDDQKAALSEIHTFIKDDEKDVFVLQGTLNSGKSFMIPYIQELAYKAGLEEVECFASSARIARNLLSSTGLEVNSLYSYIYGGSKVKATPTEDQSHNDETDTINEAELLEKIPLKASDNAENALFIVDEAQLVSDTRYQSIDMIFGSGHLLNDFLEFTKVQNSKRKIIFIGDPYQIQLGNTDESPLNPSYLEDRYSLRVSGIQLLDKDSYSHLNHEALKCVQGMKSHLYNSLFFEFDDDFRSVPRAKITDAVHNMLKQSKNGHILTYTNEDAQKINLWVKTKILHTGNDIAPGDSIAFYNNFSTENANDPFAKPQKIYNGEYAIVQEVADDSIPEPVLKGNTTVTLYFRRMRLQLQSSGDTVDILSLENFRNNAKAELSDDELVAYKILLNQQLTQNEEKYPFKDSQDEQMVLSSNEYQKELQNIEELKRDLAAGSKVKTKLKEAERRKQKLLKDAERRHKNALKMKLLSDSSSMYFQYKHAAFIRFGWAMTVHRAMSYKFDHVIFNTDQGENRGKNNDAYYRWLYTGLSRATGIVELINYTPISPFGKVELEDATPGNRSKEVFFHSVHEDQQKRLEDFEEYFTEKLHTIGLQIIKIEHPNWRERYFIDHENGSVVIDVIFDGQGNFRMPTIMKSEPAELGQQLLANLKEKHPMTDFNLSSDKWREAPYALLAKLLTAQGVSIKNIIQNNYHDLISLYSETDELEVDVWYGGNGLFSTMSPKFYSDIQIWHLFRDIIEQLKNGDSL